MEKYIGNLYLKQADSELPRLNCPPLADGGVRCRMVCRHKESADDVDILTSVRGENGWSEP